MSNLLRSAFFSLLALTSAVLSGFSFAQDFPTRPIRIIVPNTPGSQADLFSRLMSTEMSKMLGQPVVVEHKPGAGQVIGYEYTAKLSPADGYTVVAGTVSVLASLPALVKELRFDPLKDLPPFIGLAESRLFIAATASVPWKSFAEMVSYAKSNPGKLNYSSANSITRLAQAGLIRAFGIDALHVPYNAAGPAFQALVASEVQMGVVTEVQAVSSSDKIRALAVTGDRRHPGFPNVPTLTELGQPQIRSVGFSFNVRAGTPKIAVDRLYAASTRTLQLPEVAAGFAKLQLDIVNEGPEAAARTLAEEARQYAETARRIGLQPE